MEYMIGRHSAAVLICLVSLVSLGQSRSADEKQDTAMAEDAILTTLALHSTTPYICTEQPRLCMTDGADLGTALISARNTPQSLRALARLYRFAFDGAYAETLDEKVCKKGRSIEAHLAQVKPEQLRKQCIDDFEAAIKAHPQEFENAKLDQVCASIERIRAQVRDSLEMVRKPPKSCEP
jgi:hypothetical protein